MSSNYCHWLRLILAHTVSLPNQLLMQCDQLVADYRQHWGPNHHDGAPSRAAMASEAAATAATMNETQIPWERQYNKLSISQVIPNLGEHILWLLSLSMINIPLIQFYFVTLLACSCPFSFQAEQCLWPVNHYLWLKSGRKLKNQVTVWQSLNIAWTLSLSLPPFETLCPFATGEPWTSPGRSSLASSLPRLSNSPSLTRAMICLRSSRWVSARQRRTQLHVHHCNLQWWCSTGGSSRCWARNRSRTFSRPFG